MSKTIAFSCVVLSCLAVACGETDEEQNNSLLCSAPADLPCADALRLELNLQTGVAPGLISNTPMSGAWLSEVDATAGGAFAADPHSFVYARFADDGLVKVEVDDEGALDLIQWDIAFRRYIVRINSGDSGPGCTTAARMAPSTTFSSLTAVPANSVYHADDFFTDAPTCEFINDGTGLEGSPATALSGYWSYPQCVQMTHNVYVLQLRDNRHVKLEVVQYYNDTWQPVCQDDPSSFDQMQPTGAAHIQLQWAFLD